MRNEWMKNGYGNIVDSRHVTRNLAPTIERIFSLVATATKITTTTTKIIAAVIIYLKWYGIGFYELQPISYRLNIKNESEFFATWYYLFLVYFNRRTIPNVKWTRICKYFIRDVPAHYELCAHLWMCVPQVLLCSRNRFINHWSMAFTVVKPMSQHM